MAQTLLASQVLIRREFLLVHALLHPELPEIIELIDTDIALVKILNLYPLVLAELPARIEALLKTDQQVWNFASRMKSEVEENAASIYDRMAMDSYDVLRIATASLFSISHNFNSLRDAFVRVDKGTVVPAMAYQLVSDGMLSAADILWIAAHPEHLVHSAHSPKLIAQLLTSLRGILAGKANS